MSSIPRHSLHPLCGLYYSAVHVIGELAGALGFPRPKLYARYEIVLDTEHWHIMQGHEAGYTQVDETSVSGGGGCQPSSVITDGP